MRDMVGVEARSGAENGSADCLGITGVPHEYFAHRDVASVMIATLSFQRRIHLLSASILIVPAYPLDREFEALLVAAFGD
jgi:hypothetical protein